jgi:hypothetical protein
MRLIVAWLLVVLCVPAFAQSVEVDDSNEANPPVQAQPETGKDKAKQYFQSRKGNKDAGTASGDPGATPHFLALHIGTFFTDQSYKWGDGDQKNTGKLNGGVTYRLGEWVNSMDVSIRIEYTNYSFDNGTAKQLSFGPLLTFPDANSHFPLYFGGGVGAGLFIEQLHDKTPISLDWQVVAGVRFLNVFDQIGFMVETGLKNHILFEGQFNGVFINVGSVFAF